MVKHKTGYATDLFCETCGERLRKTNLSGRLYCWQCAEYKDDMTIQNEAEKVMD